MKTLSVNLAARAYPIHIGAGLLNNAALIASHLPQKRVVIVTNTVVGKRYLDKLTRALKDSNISVGTIIVPDGEPHKTTETLSQIYGELLEQRCERNTTLIALGGGVIGDLTGFAAATYLRGVPFIQIPTTLLAQVDSSVGGKTGINHPLGKNMIGAFYQPSLVLADTDTLKSLPDREYRAGLAEVIKYGFIYDALFLSWLETHLDALLAHDVDALTMAIYRSCEIKAEIVALDEREAGLRGLLNFGHTFAHAIENGLGYGVQLHGEAVGTGMAMATDLSYRLGLIDTNEKERVLKLIKRAGLMLKGPNLGADRYIELMRLDKKVESGKIRFVLLEKPGRAFISADVSEEMLRQTLGACCLNA